MKKTIYLLLFLFSMLSVAQTNTTLSYNDYIQSIVNEHPLAKSANLKQKIAKAKLLAAKGNFDPSLLSKFDEKDFKQKDYYNLFKNKITIPTPLGINITGGFENNSGKFLNPQNNISGSGLWSAGVEVDVIQGLFTNKRRTTLKQAKIYQKIAQNQQAQLLNELIYNASKAYIEWQQYTGIYEIMKTNLELSTMYLNNTKSALESGEKTAIDTLEANVYLQNSNIELVKYKQLLIEKRLKVENNLWLNNTPIALKETTVPESELILQQNNSIKPIEEINEIPVIAEKIGKKEVLILKQKLNREKLKPKLKLKYNQLFATKDTDINPIYNGEDLKWGASLKIPLLFRSERGKYRQSKYKVQEVEFDIEYKKTEIQNKIAANQQNQEALAKQITLLKQNIEGYKKLLEAESLKFDFGESSMFLVNKRQEKLIESELKLLSMQNKLITNYLDYMLLTNNILPKK